MGFFPIFRGALLGFLVLLLVVSSTQCQADEQVIQVVGIGECADCKEHKIQINHAFPGLQVTIDCKNQFGTMERWGVGKLNEEGKFKISLPKEILKGGDLKHECYAQLHSASSAPCPAQNGLESIKIVAKNDADGKHITFEPAQKLTFSTQLCTSATFWPFHKPLPKIDFWKHHYKFPPSHSKPLPPVYPTPVPKTPEPPVTIPEPPVTIPKTPEPPVTKPEPPVTIPKQPEPPVTIPKKPEPPSKSQKPCPPEPSKKPKQEKPKKKKPEKPKKEEPKKKKPEKPKKEEPKKNKPEKPKKQLPPVVKPPVEKPPTVTPPIVKPPVEKPPIVTPPIINPPIEKPPIKKLPCPPIIPKLPPKDYHHPVLPPFPTIPPKLPPFIKIPPKDYHPKLPPFPTIPPKKKLPPFPTIPPKYIHHPKLPNLVLPPHIPHA